MVQRAALFASRVGDQACAEPLQILHIAPNFQHKEYRHFAESLELIGPRHICTRDTCARTSVTSRSQCQAEISPTKHRKLTEQKKMGT